MLANAAAMNYGFAFRTATYAALPVSRPDVFGGPRQPAGGRLAAQLHLRGARRRPSGHRAPAQLLPRLPGLPDAARHGVRRDRAGGPAARDAPHLVLPLRGRRAERRRSLYSACHGAGTVIDQFADDGASRPDPAGRNTLRFRYDDTAPSRAQHLDDAGVDAAMSVLATHRIVRPVARMRPFAVLH